MLKIPQKLTSDRIYLRPPKQEDLDPFFSFISNENATQFLNFTPEQKTYERIKELLTSIINSYATEYPIFVLSIIHKLSESYIGSCGLTPVDKSPDIECYYALLPEYRGNGYVIEAMRTLFKYAFEILEMQKIVAYIHPKNTRSWKAAERAGLKYLGDILHLPTNQREMFFAITKKEFEDQNFYYALL